jgi:hypothetical protein
MHALGLLEVLRSAAPHGAPLEPQARASRLLRAAAQSAAAHTSPRPRPIRRPPAAPAVLNTTWAIDFMYDSLYDGRRFRTLNVIDEGNREGLAIDVGVSLPSVRVIALLEQLIAMHGTPQALRLDNGPELTSGALTQWCEERGINLLYIQPGQPHGTRSWSASIGPIAPKCLTPMSSSISTRSDSRAMISCTATTRSGPTTALAGCRRSRSCQGLTPLRSLLPDCLRNGGAYRSTGTPRRSTSARWGRRNSMR